MLAATTHVSAAAARNIRTAVEQGNKNCFNEKSANFERQLIGGLASQSPALFLFIGDGFV